MNIEAVKEQQIQDKYLQKWVKKYLEQYFQTDIGNVQNVLCYHKLGKDKQEQRKLALPRPILKPAIKWFHLVTGHHGERRLGLTLKSRFHPPDLTVRLGSTNFQALGDTLWYEKRENIEKFISAAYI